MWLWPATPLTERRGGALTPLPLPELYRLAAALHGPWVHAPSLARAVERAAGLLNAGRPREADEVVAACPLPPVSFDGAALMKAIGRRLDLGVPAVEIAGRPSTAPPHLFDQLARVHDAKRALRSASNRCSTRPFTGSRRARSRSIPSSIRVGLAGDRMPANSAPAAVPMTQPSLRPTPLKSTKCRRCATGLSGA